MIERIWRHGVPSAGLFAGALAWLTSTQANYALAGWACAAGLPWLTPVVAIALMLASLGGGLLSWRFWMHEEATPARDGSAAQPRRMLAGIGILSAVLFALIIAMQTMAGFVLTGCER
jgi:hypothetical protein